MKKEILKYNWWNRLFHREELMEQEDEYLECSRLVLAFTPIMNLINRAKVLEDLLDIHKIMWTIGFQNENLAPCSHGMFRTENIYDMTIDEVYLGNIYGLSTNNIRFWNQHSNEDMYGNGFGIDNNVKVYDIIFDQYKHHLSKNLMFIYTRKVNYMRCYVNNK